MPTLVNLLSTAISGYYNNPFARTPVFGPTLKSPNTSAMATFTADPTTRPRLGRVLRPNSQQEFTAGPGGYIPNDPLLSYQWFAIIPGLLNDGEFIMSLTSPSIRYDQQSRFENGKMHHYAGFMSVDDLQLTVYTDITGTATSLANHWVRDIRDQNGLYRLKAQYERNVILYLLDQNDRIISEIKYKGCWLSSWGSYSLDYNGSNILATDLTLSVDDFIVNEELSFQSTPVTQVILP